MTMNERHEVLSFHFHSVCMKLCVSIDAKRRSVGYNMPDTPLSTSFDIRSSMTASTSSKLAASKDDNMNDDEVGMYLSPTDAVKFVATLERQKENDLLLKMYRDRARNMKIFRNTSTYDDRKALFEQLKREFEY